MVKKAEPKFKITPCISGSMINGEYCTFEEQRLDKVTFPKSFDGTLEIPAGVTQLGKYLCEDKQEIKEVVLPEGIKSLGICAFKNCINLVRINMPSSLQILGESCFEGCHSLEELSFPANIYLYGTDFVGVSSDTRVSIDTTNTNFFIEDNVIYSDGGSRLVRLLSDVEEYTIKDGIKTIGAGAFMGLKQLKSITIPQGAEDIQQYAFYGCKQLESILISDTVVTYGMNMFNGCTNLKSISVTAKQADVLKGKLNEEMQELLVIRQ